MNRYIFSILIILGAVISTNAQSNALHLNFKNGTIQTIYLHEQPVITIEGTDLKITTGKTTVNYQINLLKNYKFLTEESGIENVSGQQIKYTRNGDIIIVNGDDKEMDVSITSVAGYVMDTRNGKSISIDISKYPAGVYILTVDGTTTKIVKQ